MKIIITSAKILVFLALIFFKPTLHSWLNEIGFKDFIIDPLFSFLIFSFAANLLVIGLSYLYRKGKKLRPAQTDNVLVGLHNIFYLLLTGASIITVLAFFEIDFVTLFTSLSIVAAAIAILSKDYLSEIISGIIISFSTEIGIDDFVQIGTHKGKIIDINFTKIALLNDDEDIIFIPNHKVFSSEIINYTKKQIKRVSIPFLVDLKHLTTIEELENQLIHTLDDYEQYIEKNSFWLKIDDIHKDQLMLKFQYTLLEVNKDLEREIRRKTVRRLVNYIKNNYQQH